MFKQIGWHRRSPLHRSRLVSMLAFGNAQGALIDRRTDPFQPLPGQANLPVRRRCDRPLRSSTGLSG
jgi:hypothetical protein